MWVIVLQIFYLICVMIRLIYILLCKIYRYCVNFYTYCVDLRCFVANLPLFRFTRFWVKFWLKKLRSGKSFDKYHVCNPEPFLLLTSQLRCWIRSQIASDIITSRAAFAAKKFLQFGSKVDVLLHVIDLENEEEKCNPAAGQGSCSQAVESDPDAMRWNRYKDDDCYQAVENQ